MPKCSWLTVAVVCVFMIAKSVALDAQSIQPAYPATEFIRMNGQVIAAEHIPLPSASIAVSVSPESVTLGPGQQQSFKAIVTGTSNTAVSWSISPNYGTITPAGVYTAPASVAGAPVRRRICLWSSPVGAQPIITGICRARLSGKADRRR